jgi:hypothetical protein
MPSHRKKRPLTPLPSNGLLADEQANIRDEVADLVDKPNEWLRMPNSQLGGIKPEDLIGTDREQLLRDLLRAIKFGMPT